MNNHSYPEDNECDSQGKCPAEKIEFFNTQVIQNLIGDILELSDR